MDGASTIYLMQLYKSDQREMGILGEIPGTEVGLGAQHGTAVSWSHVFSDS